MRCNRVLTITLFCALLGIVRASAQTATPTRTPTRTPTVAPTQRPASDYPTTWTIKNQTISEDQTLFQYDIYLAYTGPATDFKIGDVTLRIKFNTDALANPRVLSYYDGSLEKNLAYTDWRVRAAPNTFRWPVYEEGAGVIRLIEPVSGIVGIDTNLVSGGTYTYASTGYTDSLLALLSSDPASLHNQVQFDIVDVEQPFNIAWGTPLSTQQSITRKQTDGMGEIITSYATFEIEATATPTITPTNTPVPPTETPMETPTETPTMTPTETPTPVPPTMSPTSTPTPTAPAPSGTPTATPAGLRLEVKVYLEGPYDPATEQMNTTLQEGGYIPATSPYTDARVVSSLPSSPTPVVDWVYIQLRETATGGAVSGRSALLLADGSVADDGGDTVVRMPYPSGGEGSYFIVVYHRNHLAVMSATAHPLYSSSSELYDFTPSQDRAYGSNCMKELAAGPYGMVAGDVNCNGIIDANDRAAVWNNRQKTGYRADDCNMNCITDAADRMLTWVNRGRVTCVPGFVCQRR